MPVHSVAVSPDGSFVVAGVTGSETGAAGLFLRELGGLGVEQIAGTDAGGWPFISPDGEWVGFSTVTALWKVPVEGGEPFKLLDLDYFAYGSWGPSDTIVFAEGGSLWRVPATGGDMELVTEGSVDATAYYRPEFLPGGETVLVDARTLAGETSIAAVSLVDGTVTRVLDDGTDPIYVDSGYIVYSRADGLWATVFDPDRLVVEGRPVPVLRGVERSGVGQEDRVGATQFGVSLGGTLAYRAEGNRERSGSLVWVGRDGTTEPVRTAASVEGGRVFLGRASPDEERIVIHGRDDTGQGLWLYDLRSNIRAPFVTDYGAASPVWSPDGAWVYFSGNSGEGARIYRKAASGLGDPEEIAVVGDQAIPRSISADGARLLYAQGEEIYELDVEAARHPGSSSKGPIRSTRGHCPRMATSSRSVARPEAGQAVWVRAVDGSGESQVSQDGGHQAAWSRDGRELFYVLNGSLYVVDVRREPGFSTGEPRLLVPDVFEQSFGLVRYQPSPDGQRFLVANETGSDLDQSVEITVVTGWGEELSRIVGQ